MIEQQARYDVLETEKSGLNSNNADDRFRLTVIEQEQASIKEQIDAVDRLNRQANEVAVIELPENYDLRFGFDGANDEIRSLISQVKEYLFSQHNDEIAKLMEDNKERIRIMEEDKAELINMIASLEITVTSLESKVAEVDGRALRAEAKSRTAEVDKQTAIEQRADAESKRDAAVVAKEEAEADREKALNEVKSLNSQINELEGMLRTYRSQAKAGTSGGLVLTSTLKPVSEEERIAKAERERIEHINRGLLRIGQEPLPLPTSPAQAEAAAAIEEPEEERFPAHENAHDSERLDEADEAVEVAGEPLTLEGLNERLLALEEWQSKLEEFSDRLGL